MIVLNGARSHGNIWSLVTSSATKHLMQLHKYRPRFAGCLMAAALITLFPACKPLAHSKATPVVDAHLQSFFADKEQQARNVKARANGPGMSWEKIFEACRAATIMRMDFPHVPVMCDVSCRPYRPQRFSYVRDPGLSHPGLSVPWDAIKNLLMHDKNDCHSPARNPRM